MERETPEQGTAVAASLDDGTLGKALKAGDAAGAEGLFRRYGQPIHDFVQRLVHDSSTADDLTQTTFVRAIERSSELRDPRRVRSWLYSIALNLARDHLTKHRATRQAELPAGVPSGQDDPEQTAQRHATEVLVWSAVASMELHQRIALDLAIRHDLSSREIGTALGVSPARASLTITRARSSFRHALRSLLVAQSRTHCDRLAELVPTGVRALSPDQRRSVEHHLKHCGVCQSRASVLTSPLELLGGIALLPLPPALGHGWMQRVAPMPSSHSATAHVGWATRLRSPAALGAGAATLLLFGGGVAVLHAVQRPAIVATTPRTFASLAPAGDVGAAPTVPTSPTPSQTTTPSAAEQWAASQAMMRNAHGYHVTYGSYYVYPQGGAPGNPVRFDLTLAPNGDFQGTYFAIDGFIGQFDIRRVAGALAVRHISLAGTFGVAGAPQTATEFFGVTYAQAQALGDSWLPLTGAAQRAAAATLNAALGPYTDSARLADDVLALPATIDSVGPGLESGSTSLQAGDRKLTFRVAPDPFIEYSTATFVLHVDAIGG